DNSLRLEKAKDKGIVDSGCSRNRAVTGEEGVAIALPLVGSLIGDEGAEGT
nr:hypothetical protein [Tanacetum cinerariifolium]